MSGNPREPSVLSSSSSSSSPIPPFPKLRPRPFVSSSLEDEDDNEEENDNENQDSSSTSRLLMKSECRSTGGRRKNSGSLIHSIPKFSEVKPSGRLFEVQRVLQSRIIHKQLVRKQAESKDDLVASHLLQNMISKHVESLDSKIVKVRRGRKLKKSQITHVLPSTLPLYSEVSITPRLQSVTEEALDLSVKSSRTFFSSSSSSPTSPSSSSLIWTPLFSQNKVGCNSHEKHSKPVNKSTRKVLQESILSKCKMESLRHKRLGVQNGSEHSSEVNSEVSICKFKFIGGSKPSLEKRKSLSVDSGGNFRYVSGSGDKTLRGFEILSKEVMTSNASIVTDKFTSLTADKIAKNHKYTTFRDESKVDNEEEERDERYSKFPHGKEDETYSEEKDKSMSRKKNERDVNIEDDNDDEII